MSNTLKAIIRLAAAVAAAQGVAVPLLTSEGVTAKWVSGIFGAVALAGLLAEVGLDTLGNAQSTTPAKPS
jgi:hypothetical protein